MKKEENEKNELLKQVESIQNIIHNPILDSIRKVTHNPILENIQKITNNPILRNIQRVTNPINHLYELQKTFKVTQNILSQIELQKNIEITQHKYDPFHSELQKNLEITQRIYDSFPSIRKIQDQIQHTNSYLEQLKIQEKINEFINPLIHDFSSSKIDDIFIDSSGNITVSDEAISTKEIQNCIDDISDNYSGINDFFKNLSNNLSGLKKPIRIFFIYILLPYILAIFANLMTPIHEKWWSEYSNIKQRIAKKEIIKEANEFYTQEQLHGYKFVSTPILHVRISGNKNSDIIDELTLGKVVKIIRKDKRWTLIEYENFDSSDLVQGWVFSRYLNTFNK